MKTVALIASCLLLFSSTINADVLEEKREWVKSILAEAPHLQKNQNNRDLQAVTSENFRADVCQPLIETMLLKEPDIDCLCNEARLELGCTFPQVCVSGSQFGVQFAQTCGNETVETCFKFGFTETFGPDGTVVSFSDDIDFDQDGGVDYGEAKMERGDDGTCTIQFRLNESLYECYSCEPCMDDGYKINCTNMQTQAFTSGDTCGSLLSVFSLCPSQGAFTPATNPLSEQPAFCFSGDTTVNVLVVDDTNANAEEEQVVVVPMKDLKIGDMVQVNKGDGIPQYEPIYSFGHYGPHAKNTRLLAIATNHTTKRAALEISPQHMVFLSSGSAVPASMIRKGDLLQTANNGAAMVTSVKTTTTHSGVFAPFTKSGTIVVNDNAIVASTYVAFQDDSEYFAIGSMTLPWTHQWLANVFIKSIHGIVKMTKTDTDTYCPDTGVALWIQGPHEWANWTMEQQQSSWMMLLLLIPAVAVASVVSFMVEQQQHIVCFSLVVVAMMMMVRNNKKQKQKTL